MNEFEAFVRNDETGEQEKVHVVGGPVSPGDGEVWVNTRTGEQFTVTAEPRESTLTEEQIAACAGFTLEEIRRMAPAWRYGSFD